MEVIKNTATRKQAALSDLLGVDKPVGWQDYPEQITLPDYVHYKVQKAVSRTAEDGAERSVHFRRASKVWLAGCAFKGTGFDNGKDAHTSPMHGVGGLLGRTFHIDFHTHPTLKFRHIVNYAFSKQTRHEWSADRTLEFAQNLLEDEKELSMLPSSADVFAAMASARPHLASMISSEGGTFLYVQKDITCKGRFINDAYESISKMIIPHSRIRLDSVKETVRKIEDAEFEARDEALTGEVHRRFILDAIVRALSCEYVSYKNSDIKSPVLQKQVI